MDSSNNNITRMDVLLSSIDGDLISVTQALAKEATEFFQSGKYVDCLRVLNQILEKKVDDPKVLHNIAIVENFQDGFSNPKRFLEALYNLKKRSERLAHSTGQNADTLNNKIKFVGNNIVANSTNDFDASLTMFNIAVILYHLHEYEKCLSILERLYQNIEPLDERVAHHVCLLLLDVSLVCHHVSTAADVIDYLERVGGNSLGGSQGDSGNLTQQLTNSVTKSTSAPNNVMIAESISSDSPLNLNGPESPLARTPSEEKLFESLMSSLDKRSDLTRTQTDDDDSLTTTTDLRLKVHLYKLWVLILTRNLKAAMNIAAQVQEDHTLALFLKSQLEYARNNHSEAIKLLIASVTQTGPSALYYNNLGCIYYKLGKYMTSTSCFSKALSYSSLQKKEKPMKLLSYSQDKSVLFAYNCGLVYLASGKPVLAVRCFQQASSIFFKQPLLWLRIAECCIMNSDKKADINVNVIGREKWRLLVLECLNSKNVVQIEPNLSLTFAKSCLLNALKFLDSFDGPNLKMGLVNSNGEVKESKVGYSVLLQSSVNEYEGVCGKEKKMILQAVLADLAFVYLELGNPVKALSTSKSLLKLPECSRVYAFLGNVYAAEAYCLLNQPKQASEHLSTYISEQNSTIVLPYSQEDRDIWQMRKTVDPEEPNYSNTLFLDQSIPFSLKPEEARGVVYANMACSAAVEGDIERAQEAVNVALSILPDCTEVVITATYVDLVCGNNRDAVMRLKQCRRVRFLNVTLADK